MQTTEKITSAQIINLLEKSYHLSFVNYDQSLDDHTKMIEKAIEERSKQPIYEEVWEWECESQDYGMEYALNELKDAICNEFDIEEYEAEELMEEFEDEIRDEIHNRDKSTFCDDLLRNTSSVPVMIEMFSNYDCINSHWLESAEGYWYEESYFGQVVDVLNLNPATVKKILVEKGEKVFGKWPNKKNRDGKEYVSLKDFREEDVNRSCGANLLVFIGLIDLSEMVEDFTTVTIPKGNTCGFFSSCQGGGSMLEMELLRPITINLERQHGTTKYDSWGISTANNGSYSIKSVYGVSNDFFGGEITTSKD